MEKEGFSWGANVQNRRLLRYHGFVFVLSDFLSQKINKLDQIGGNRFFCGLLDDKMAKMLGN